MLPPILKNKYFTWGFNIVYIVGFIIAIERGFYGWYFLCSMVVLLLLYGKPLYKIMQFGGKMYADWCKDTSEKTIGKFNPWKDKK